MSTQISICDPYSTNNSSFASPSEIVQDLAVSSCRDSYDHIRSRSTNRKFEENTFPAQGTSSNFVTAPVTYPTGFQPGRLRSSSLLAPTDGSERAYTPVIRDNISNHSDAEVHQSNTPKTLSFADAKFCPRYDQTLVTNGNDRSGGPLMDRHLPADHWLTPTLQNVVPENAIHIREGRSRSPGSPGSTQRTTIEDIRFGTVSHNLPSRHEFTKAVDRYLSALSSKKISKALITQQLYEDIIFNLKCEKNNRPGIGTPQFRFWCRKHFVLKIIPRLRIREQAEIVGSTATLPIGNQDDGDSEDVEVVAHDGQPVVTKETIYDVLIKCHTLANHAGRDKTTALVKHNYVSSKWIVSVLFNSSYSNDLAELGP
ncbi:hypothetical protein BN14_05771 [Rhizoctonia solani AG-1 IB]|uniref:Uncharacterized protein n=1 Tax=Thanatephorus cucumeris (strain AG1-IB / isolate 7/3/14) TaxID=1108050 RepID=M5C782_THACB|nr:hypothetical protein BN14_05771 [Rhizoctonia solani AG-1 IB]